MANILVIPVCPHTDAAQAAVGIAAQLPGAAVFNVTENAEEAVRLASAGKADDWFDLLIGRAAALNAQNLVIQGIAPNDAHLFLSRLNNDLAGAFNARVVFAVSSGHATAERLNMAKASFAGRAVEFGGVIGAPAAVAEAAGLAFLGSIEKPENTAALAAQNVLEEAGVTL